MNIIELKEKIKNLDLSLENHLDTIKEVKNEIEQTLEKLFTIIDTNFTAHQHSILTKKESEKIFEI